jgi:hypothetical protein
LEARLQAAAHYICHGYICHGCGSGMRLWQQQRLCAEWSSPWLGIMPLDVPLGMPLEV